MSKAIKAYILHSDKGKPMQVQILKTLLKKINERNKGKGRQFSSLSDLINRLIETRTTSHTQRLFFESGFSRWQAIQKTLSLSVIQLQAMKNITEHNELKCILIMGAYKQNPCSANNSVPVNTIDFQSQ
mgnify:CR=1 FL=1